jgi:TolA-binding protein
MRPRRPVALNLVALVAALLLPLGVVACSDAPAPVKAPVQPPAPSGYYPNMPPPQIGMTDAPSGLRPGEVPDQAPRPSMSSGASGLYQQALQAFANGDLVNARSLFQQTTQADPRAHQAFYSLAVVQERLRDPGAGAGYRQAFTIVPDYEPAIIGYAMLLAKQNQLSDAERVLTEKRGQMPRSAAVAATLAEIKSL